MLRSTIKVVSKPSSKEQKGTNLTILVICKPNQKLRKQFLSNTKNRCMYYTTKACQSVEKVNNL